MKRVAEEYDRVAARYDDAYLDRRCAAEDAALRAVLEPLVADCDVLDLGCGTGRTLELARTLDPRRYLGTDVSERMLARAREKHPLARFEPGDQFASPPALGSFDAVTSLWSLNYARDLGQLCDAARWMRAALRRGGRLLAVLGGPRRAGRPGYGEGMPLDQRYWPAERVKAAFAPWFDVRLRGLALSVDRMPGWAPQPALDLVTRAESATLGRVAPDLFYFFVVTGVRR